MGDSRNFVQFSTPRASHVNSLFTQTPHATPSNANGNAVQPHTPGSSSVWARFHKDGLLSSEVLSKAEAEETLKQLAKLQTQVLLATPQRLSNTYQSHR